MTIELYLAINQVLEDVYLDDKLRRQQTGRMYGAVFQGIRDVSESRFSFSSGGIADLYGRKILADSAGLVVNYHIGHDTTLEQLPPSGCRVKKLITPGGIELLKKPKSRNAVLDHAPLGPQSRDIIENAIELLGNRD